MAYKSRVTNQYMGAGFAGQVASATSSDTTDLIKILQKDVNPALGKIADTYITQKQDTAKAKINELFLTKDSATVQQEILDGKHPELSSGYVQKVVDLQSGRQSAAETQIEIEKNKLKYNPQETNLPAFYKDFYPDFKDKSGTFALGFASVFNDYKAKEAIKDASARAKVAQTQKFNSISAVLDVQDASTYHQTANSYMINLPPEEGDTKKRQYATTTEMNDYVIQNLTNNIATATTI